MAIPTRTACVCGYSHAHKTLILVYISVRVAIATAHVRVAKSRARILYTNTQPASIRGPVLLSVHLFQLASESLRDVVAR